MGLNVSRHHPRHRLPLEASILFLVLAIATGGIDLVAQGEASISGGLWGLCCWVCFNSELLDCVLLGCVDSGCIDLVAGFVFLVFC